MQVICQDANGGLAMGNGNHTSQQFMNTAQKAASIEAFENKEVEQEQTSPIETFETIPPPEGVERITDTENRIVYNIPDPGGDFLSDVELMFDKKGDTWDVNFTVGGDFSNEGKGNAETLNLISKTFRHHVSTTPANTKFATSAFGADLRGDFRRGIYAKAGFSFEGGRSTPGTGKEGRMLAVNVGGKITPAKENGKPFSAADQKTHKASARRFLLKAVKEARQARGNE